LLLAVLLVLATVAGCSKPQQLLVGPPSAVAKPAFVYEPIPEPTAHRTARAAPRPAVHRPRTPPLPEHEPEWEVHGAIRPWRFIVVHHSATHKGCAAVFDQWHRNHNGWDELGYHFVIGNGTYTGDGDVEVGSRWPKQKHGAHCKVGQDETYNDFGIGICLVGNFEKEWPSEAQMRSLARLVDYLSARFEIPDSHIVGHGDVDDTRCPGRHFSLADLFRRLSRRRVARDAMAAGQAK
jgi:hypothetical protein